MKSSLLVGAGCLIGMGLMGIVNWINFYHPLVQPQNEPSGGGAISIIIAGLVMLWVARNKIP